MIIDDILDENIVFVKNSTTYTYLIYIIIINVITFIYNKLFG